MTPNVKEANFLFKAPDTSIFYKLLLREMRKNSKKLKQEHNTKMVATFSNIGDTIHQVMSNFYTHKFTKNLHKSVSVVKALEALNQKVSV